MSFKIGLIIKFWLILTVKSFDYLSILIDNLNMEA